MGYGESYYIKFLRWYRSLSKVDAEAYARKNPEFEEWIGFYDQLLHKTRPSDDVLRIAAEKIRKLHNRSE